MKDTGVFKVSKSLLWFFPLIMLLFSSMFLFPQMTQALDNGSVTYEHNLLTIKGPTISRNTILSVIDSIPSEDYFGVLVDGDVEITDCIIAHYMVDVDASFLQKRDHITSYQCLGTITFYAEPATDKYPYIDMSYLFSNLGSSEHPVTQLDARGLNMLNIYSWTNAFSNTSGMCHSINWVGVEGTTDNPDFDIAKMDSASLQTIISIPNTNQIIMSPSSMGYLPVKNWENLDVDIYDQGYFKDAKLFIDGKEDKTYSFENDLMFSYISILSVRGHATYRDNVCVYRLLSKLYSYLCSR